MYKVAILGCENSHANSFLDAVINERAADDIEFVGVYSEDREAAGRLQEKFGVHIAKRYDEFAGRVDGILITARHGDNHYKYARPYIESGIPMFIDKPVTCTEEDARLFMEELKKSSVRVCGGSACVYADWVQKLKREVSDRKYGRVVGGYLRAPLLQLEPYGGFLFYAQHMVQIMTEIFGYFPVKVWAGRNGDACNCLVRFRDFDVSLNYVEDNHLYYAGISCENAYVGDTFQLDDCFKREFMGFYELLRGGQQRQSYEEFFAPVFIMNAINRAIKSGKEEEICY